eukprot:2657123-Rhodomonas_salina.2
MRDPTPRVVGSYPSEPDTKSECNAVPVCKQHTAVKVNQTQLDRVFAPPFELHIPPDIIHVFRLNQGRQLCFQKDK